MPRTPSRSLRACKVHLMLTLSHKLVTTEKTGQNYFIFYLNTGDEFVKAWCY